jgi:hypothetical protein
VPGVGIQALNIVAVAVIVAALRVERGSSSKPSLWYR